MSGDRPGVTVTGAAIGNPFVGLRRFDTTDSHLFFGRDEQTYELLRRLRLMHFLAVIGPSGCGKSSLIRAGVMAALRDGFLADDGDWRLVTLQPGNGPLAAWTAALRPHVKPGVSDEAIVRDPAAALDPGPGPIAILVDQFEELFQYAARTGRSDEAHAFVESIIRTGAPDARIYTILTMRSEYLAQCAEYPLLADAINSGLHLVSRMTPAQIREAIVMPVHKAGAAITVALTDRLADEAVREADGLPVLQHALMRMWNNRAPFEPLSDSSTGTTRSLGEFVNDHAEQVYTNLSPEQKVAAEKLFRCISEMTDEGNLVRRATEFDRICAATGVPAGVMRTVVEAFERDGFLVVSQSAGGGSPLIDISHEAIARQWRRLGSKDPLAEGWIVNEARHRTALEQIERAAAEWNANAQGNDFLFKGLRLELSSRHIAGRESQLSAAGRQFLLASRKRDEREKWLSPKVLVPSTTALVLIIGLSIYSLATRQNLAHESDRAAEAESLLVEQIDRSDSAATQTGGRPAPVTATPKPPNPSAKPDPAVVATAPPVAVPPPTEPAPSSSGPNLLQPRVYIQIREQSQRDQAARAAAALRGARIVVPGVELVKVGPSSTEMRYFKAEEQDEVRRAVGVLAAAGVQVTLRFVQLKERSRARPFHFELWLAPETAAKY